MNLIKRLTTSVTASLENTVRQIENHDAIIEAAIKQTRQSVAKTKARINTLRQQQHTYETQLEETREQSNLWTQRALNLSDSDQDKALQCMTRHNQCQTKIARLSKLIEQQKTLIHDVSLNSEKLQMSMDEMHQKHNLMRSRQTVADVNRTVGATNLEDTTNETFERWESMIIETEMNINDITTRDPLETEFTQQENDILLLQQLHELKSKHNNTED